MLFAQNVFGRVAGIFFVVVLICAVCFYAFVCVKGLISKIKRNKKLKEDKERLSKNDDKEAKKIVDKN